MSKRNLRLGICLRWWCNWFYFLMRRRIRSMLDWTIGSQWWQRLLLELWGKLMKKLMLLRGLGEMFGQGSELWFMPGLSKMKFTSSISRIWIQCCIHCHADLIAELKEKRENNSQKEEILFHLAKRLYENIIIVKYYT